MKINRWQRLRWTIPLVLFLTTIIDASLPAIFPHAFLGNQQIIISHITLYFITTFAFYFRDGNMLFYSFLFGLFYDSYNTTILGLNASIYFAIAYFIMNIKKYFPKKPVIHFMLYIVSIVVLDFLVYLFYSELGYANISVTIFMVSRLSPSLIFNTVMAIVLYFPTKSLMRWLGYEDYIIF